MFFSSAQLEITHNLVMWINEHVPSMVEGAKSNTPPKSNTYKRLLIMYSEHTWKHLDVSNAKHRGIRVKNGVEFGQKWDWIWGNISYKSSIQWLVGNLVLVREQFGQKVGTILGENGLGFG